MTEPTKQLRKICQDSREYGAYKIDWVERNLVRSVSNYFTKLCLKIGISANQVTLIDFVLGLATGIYFLSREPKSWIIGSLLMYLFRMFDCVDGEVARYNKSVSPLGQYFDDLTFFLLWPYILICMTFSLYSLSHHIIIFVFGFVAVASFLLIYFIPTLLVLPVLTRGGLAPEDSVLDRAKLPSAKQKFPSLVELGAKLGSLIFGELSFYAILLIVSVADCFISPFTISSIPLLGSVTANIRYFCFIAYAIGTFAYALRTTHTTYQQGLRQPRL